MSTLHRLFLIGVALVSSGCAAFAYGETPTRLPEELDTLLGPIALHPDPLLAQILPACTQPAQIVLAARFVRANPSRPDLIDAQLWDDSVKAVARIPSLIAWLDENLEWATQVGEAFTNQPADVSNSVQRLRHKAYDLGNLQSGSQQTVVIEDGQVQILPASPQIVYVPVYEPQVIYVERPRPDHFWLTFGVGFTVGTWFNHDWDWGRHTIIVWHPHSPRPIDYWRHHGPGHRDPYPEHHIDWRPRHDRSDHPMDRPHTPRPVVRPHQNPPDNPHQFQDRHDNLRRWEDRNRDSRRPRRDTPNTRPVNDPNLHRPHPTTPDNPPTRTQRPDSSSPHEPQMRAAPRKDIGTHPQAPTRQQDNPPRTEPAPTAPQESDKGQTPPANHGRRN